MGTTITFRRGENDPTSGSGLTLAEPAFNTTLKTFHIGLGYGITAAWVGAPISGLSADIAAGITYKIPSAAAVKNYIGGLCYGNTGAPTITQYVSSFNGLTGAVGGVCAAQANTFTALQSFANGISASGITVNGNMSVTGNFTVSGGVTFTTSETVLIEDNIITLNSNVTGSPSENAGIEIERGTSANVQLLWNESSDRWTFTNDGSTYYDLPTSVVTSFNGRTGAVTGASLGANTFTGLNSFNAGISSYGGTFSDQVRFTSGLSASDVKTLNLSGNGTLSPSFTDGQFRLTQFGPSYTTVAASGSTDRTITLPDNSGTVALTSQLMGTVNGSTAATTAVTSFNGLSGAVTLASGSNITLTPSGNTITIASTASGGGFTRSIFTITTSTTAGSTASTDYVYIGATSDNINLTLPTAAGNTNRYTVKNSNIGTFTVLTTSSQTIDGATAYALTKQFQAIDLLSDNTNWIVA